MKAQILLLAALIPLHIPLPAHAVMPVVNLNSPATPTPVSSRTLELLSADPLQVYQMGLSPEEQDELMNQVLKANADGASRSPEESGALIQKANFLDDLFGGGQRAPAPMPAPQYAPRPSAPVPQSQAIPQRSVKLPSAPSEPAIVFDHDSMKDLNDWKVKYFDVVVVINKAVNGQTAYVYQKNAQGVPELVMSTKVSTGREGRELSNEDRLALGMNRSGHAPTSSYFSNTPTGYWTPIKFSIDHVSGDWEDAAMDHAVFFNSRGIATHRAPVGTEAQLGHRASGACVRMSRSDARELFWIIRRTGGPVTSAELAGGNFERSSPGPSFKKEYENRLASGFNTYDQLPDIPVFERNGSVKTAVDVEGKPVLTADGQTVPAMRKGLARTLIVVENRPLAGTNPARRRGN